MKRHRLGAPPPHGSSSDDDDEEDAFAALSSRPKSIGAVTNKRAKSAETPVAAVVAAPPSLSSIPPPISGNVSSNGDQQQENEQQQHRPAPITSSMKRHHVALNDSRKAKLDAMLVELQQTEQLKKNSSRGGGGGAGGTSSASSSSAFVPHKKGSFVEAGQESSTTNLFVGNLAPHIIEDQLGDLFRQFGDLYSLKIMYARTEEERARNRQSGFVCFEHRRDAEAAMHALDDTDPFRCGRRLIIRWGKDIRGGEQQQGSSNHKTEKEDVNSGSICVEPPRDSRRARFIDTVAEFVAKDGSRLEELLLERERKNPDFNFLFPPPEKRKASSGAGDHAYYKWKVYSLCQLDGTAAAGRTTSPFSMLHGGCLWIPPSATSSNTAGSSRTTASGSSNRKLDSMVKKRTDGTAKLDAHELAQAHQLFRVQLCTSRESICQAMAFCFEKTAAAHHVASLLQDLFLEVSCHLKNEKDDGMTCNDEHMMTRKQIKKKKKSHVRVETLISRLYLVSDILFNSQQPTIKNAFLYRTAVESMAPTIFACMGDYIKFNPEVGRFTQHKLSTAVHVVLQAWATWDVFNHAFLEELQAKFEGREPSSTTNENEALRQDNDDETAVGSRGLGNDDEDDDIKNNQEGTNIGQPPEPVREIAQGQWTVVEEDSHQDSQDVSSSVPHAIPSTASTSASRTSAAIAAVEREEDADGEPLDPDDALLSSFPPEKADADRGSNPEDKKDYPDGDPLGGKYFNDADGVPVDDDDADGVPLDDADGVPLDDDDGADGVPLDDDDADGVPLDDDDADGVPLDDDPDGVPLDKNEFAERGQKLDCRNNIRYS